MTGFWKWAFISDDGYTTWTPLDRLADVLIYFATCEDFSCLQSLHWCHSAICDLFPHVNNMPLSSGKSSALVGHT